MRIQDKKRLALVLSGGGVKAAAFHIGVCIALKEKGFKFAGGSRDHVEKIFDDDAMTFKIYVGSSAGSVISTFLAAGYDINTVVEAFLKGSGEEFSGFIRKGRGEPAPSFLKPFSYSDIFSLNIDSKNPVRLLSQLMKKKPIISGGLEVLFKRGFRVNGLFNTRNLERYLRENCHPENTFESLGVQLYIVATQLNHSRKVVFGPFEENRGNQHIKSKGHAKVSEAVAASASLPPFFAPYPITNTKGKEIYYFDGEIRDTLSTHVAVDQGADLVISSYSIQPYHFNEDIGSLHEYGMPVISNQALYQVVQQKIINHIRQNRKMRDLMNAVNGYLKEIDLNQEHRDKLMTILEERSGYNPDVDYMYIHPKHEDYEFFFADHFSLNPEILAKIVKTGFRAAMQTLRRHNI